MKIDFLKKYDFFVGVPDSQLKALCDYLYETYGVGENHVVAANEGNAVAIALGYHLATGKVPVVYLQNSGIGNIINPVASLLNGKIYKIPCVFIVGWRGEPGVHDEPQHLFQGEVTLPMLKDAGIETFVISKETTDKELDCAEKEFEKKLNDGKQVAYVIKKNALEFSGSVLHKNENTISRESAIEQIAKIAKDDFIVSTTGKISRELFEIREKNKEGHGRDFLTVGGMGHASSIAFGMALKNKGHKIWCIDGDGAVLMHMGAMSVIGTSGVHNLVHVVLNNEAHESVGGMPTVANKIDMCKIAEGCGYKNVLKIDKISDLENVLDSAKKSDELSFIEVKCMLSARKDLGRPTTTPLQNKIDLMSEMKMKN